MTSEDQPPAENDAELPTVPHGLAHASTIRRVRLLAAELLDILVVPVSNPLDQPKVPQDPVEVEVDIPEIINRWLAATHHASRPLIPPSVVVPLYGCLVAWSVGRAAVVGPPDRLVTLEGAVLDFAAREAELHAAEEEASRLLDAVVFDAGDVVASDPNADDHRGHLARRYVEAVTVSRRLSGIAPGIHAPPVHPPTLASQLGERLRDRTRLLERHELAVERASLAERIAEASRQRADELGIARRQTGLEWAIVVLLVVQTTLLVVDLLSRQGTP